MIKLFIDESSNIYLVDSKDNLIKMIFKNNEECFFEFYGNGKISFEISIDDELYNIFLNFYLSLMERSFEYENIDSTNCHITYQNGVITIKSDDNFLKIYLLNDIIKLEYINNSNNIMKISGFAYNGFFNYFNQLFYDISKATIIDQSSESFQIIKKYNQLQNV